MSETTEEFLARLRAERAAKDRLAEASKAQYTTLSEGISKELPSNISYNPNATNWMFSLSGPRMTDQSYMSGLTNIPNTLVASGHGLPGFLPTGLSPDTSVTNKLSELVRERNVVVDNSVGELFRKINATGGGVTLPEIAKAIGSQTNDVKRVILNACFNAGYTPEEIRKSFPNADEIIATPANEHFASLLSFGDLFKKTPSNETNILDPYVSKFHRFTPASTNVVESASDWLKPIPSSMNKFIK